jgi:hypothetical protein
MGYPEGRKAKPQNKWQHTANDEGSEGVQHRKGDGESSQEEAEKSNNETAQIKSLLHGLPKA